MVHQFLVFLNKLFADFFPFYVKIKDVKVYYNSLDRFLACILWKAGLLEGYEMNLFITKLKEGDVVLDIGANMGVYSLLSSQRVGPNGKILAFEPDKDNFQCLAKSIEKNKFKNIIVYPFAVSNKEETIYFQKNAFNSGNHQIRKEKTADNQASIKAVCLDDFLKEEPKIDVIKIDIQGAEFFAFEGLKDIINRFPNIVIFAEYWADGLKKMGVKPGDYLDLLKSLDLNIFMIDGKNSKLIPLNYDDIINNKSYEKDYLNFVLTKGGNLNFV